MKKIIKREFFKQPTLTVAKELLGNFLCRQIGKRTIRLKITETEAYDGPRDRASHAHRGKTARNAPMFGEAGKFYVYFTYGMHWMLNVVTGPKDYPAAVLIRGTDKVTRPARLTKFLSINKSFNEKPATRKTGLWFEDGGERVNPREIKRTPRIGVAYAGPVWSKKPYRFIVTAENTPSACSGDESATKVMRRRSRHLRNKVCPDASSTDADAYPIGSPNTPPSLRGNGLSRG